MSRVGGEHGKACPVGATHPGHRDLLAESTIGRTHASAQLGSQLTPVRTSLLTQGGPLARAA